MGLFFNQGAVDPSVTAAKQNFADMFNSMYSETQAAFGQYTGAMNLIADKLLPTIMSGQIPYGYSPQLDSLLNTSIMRQASIGTRNALNAAQLAAKQASGGAALAPGGANDAINALITSQGVASMNDQLVQKMIAGYQAGGQQLNEAIQAATEQAKTAGAVASDTSAEANKAASGQLEAGQVAFQQAEQGSVLNDIMRTAQTVGQVEGDVLGAGKIAGQFTNPVAPTPQQQQQQLTYNIPGLATDPNNPGFYASPGSTPPMGPQTYPTLDSVMAPQAPSAPAPSVPQAPFSTFLTGH